MSDPGELADAVGDATGGRGAEVSIDCSGHPDARVAALRHTRHWGRCVLVGEGNAMTFDVSPLFIHPQISLYGSWVSSVQHMAELLDRLVRRGEHHERIVTHRFAVGRRDRIPGRRRRRGRQGLHRLGGLTWHEGTAPHPEGTEVHLAQTGDLRAAVRLADRGRIL